MSDLIYEYCEYNYITRRKFTLVCLFYNYKKMLARINKVFTHIVFGHVKILNPNQKSFSRS